MKMTDEKLQVLFNAGSRILLFKHTYDATTDTTADSTPTRHFHDPLMLLERARARACVDGGASAPSIRRRARAENESKRRGSAHHFFFLPFLLLPDDLAGGEDSAAPPCSVIIVMSTDARRVWC